jgi:hypothetical protein
MLERGIIGRLYQIRGRINQVILIVYSEGRQSRQGVILIQRNHTNTYNEFEERK